METRVQQQETHAHIQDADRSAELEMFNTIRNSEVGKDMTPAEIRQAMIDLCLRKP